MASRRRAAFAYAFIALALCPTIFSAPTPQQSCSPVCNEVRHSIVHYEQGKTYIYNFDTEVVTQLVGSTDETNRIKVKGQAAVAAQSSCDLLLTIQNIAITSTSGQAISSVGDIEGSSIRFGYNDGVIDSVCVSDDDPSWSANIKRAIVSMLGNRALNGDTETIETDVNGKCPTTHEHSGNRHTKTKDLQACSNRDGGMAHIFGVPFTNPSKYHTIPVFTSSLTCVQELGKGVIQNVECTEGHALDVIQSSGVRSDIKSTLSLANVQSSLVAGHNTNKRSCLLFDFGDVDGTKRQKTAAANSKALLTKLCTEIESGTVSLKVPSLFLQLRKQARYATSADLKRLHEEISSGKICDKSKGQLNKLLLDAAAMSAGDGPISFLAEVLASNEEVQETTKDLFIAYAAFAEHPGSEALESLQALVSKENLQSDYLLAASGYAHQYCKISNHNCGSCEKYQGLVSAIAQHVHVATEEADIEKVIVALQALGNLDTLTPAAVTAIINLIEDSHTNQRLKMRALDAARRDPCQETLKRKAEKIFSDIKEASHVRIQAYLTFSKCFTPDDVSIVQAVIDNDEESNQVGSFVVSHVSNVVESSSPYKSSQKEVFQLLKLREFPSDVRKFSRNFELSLFQPSMMNSGLAFESNLIFSQDSYIPRCSNANFTVDAFGRSYNLMELGLCTEHFEDIFERIMGPTSKLRTVTLDDVIREGIEKLGRLKSSISNRFKRDVAVDVHQNEIDAIRSQVDIHERTGSNANGDLYVRILGTSILAESFSRDGLTHQPLTTRILRAMDNLAQGVHEQNIDLTEPFMFMDDEIILPTSFGIPLTVNTEGTTVLSLQVHGNLDVPSLLRGSNADMKAKIVPSAATVVRARIVLGDGPLRSGLQVEGKIHSAAGLEVGVVRENKKFELRVNIPQERIQVFDIRSDVFWIEQAADQLEKKTQVQTKLPQRSVVENHCTTAFNKAVGLKVCADIKVPQVTAAAPFFFLNGQSIASLSIEKTEASMQGYYFMVEGIKESETYGVDLVFDTPGSTTNRKVSAHARAVSPTSLTPSYTLKIESPLNNVEVNYKRSFTDDLKGVEVRVAVDDETYTGIAEVRKTSEGAGYRLAPLIQYQLPHGNPVKLLEGEIIRVPGQKLSVDIKTGGPFPYIKGNIKGNIVVNKNGEDDVDIEYKDLEFASKMAGKILIGGSYKRKGKLVDVKFDSKYGQDAQHTLTVDATVGSPTPRENVLKVTTRSSRREFLNFDVDWSLKRGDHNIDHSFKYTRGLTEPKVVIKQESEIKIVSFKEFDVESELTIIHPTYNINFHAEAEAKSVPGQEREAKIEVKANDVQAKLDYQASGELLSNYKILGRVVAGGKTFEVSEVATKIDENKRNYKSHLSVQPGFFYNMDTDVYLKYAKGEFKSDLSSTITSDQLENPIALKTTVAANADGYDANLKFDAQGKNYADVQTSHHITRGSPNSYATKMKVHVLNYVDAKLNNVYSGGNGDLSFDAVFAKSGRKIVGASKVQRSGDTYDLKADLKWDADRDPTKSISLKSTTTLSSSELGIDSKNDITCNDKTTKINVRGSLSRDITNGQSVAEFDYTSPSGKTYSVASKINLENKRTVRAGKLELHIAPADVAPSELEVGVRASNLDQQDRTFDIKADIKANYRNQKDLKVHGELSSTLPGNYRSYAGRLAAEGSALPKPLELSLKTDVKSGRVALKGEIVHPVKSTLDATVDYDCWAPKKTVGIKYTLTTPIERIQSVEGEIQGGYLYNSHKNFELSNVVSIALNGGAPMSVSNSLSVLENEGKYEHKFVSEGNPVITISADGKLDRRHFRAHLNSDVRGTVSKLNLDIEHQLPNIDIKLKGETTLADESKSFELKVANKKNEDGTLLTEVIARVDDDDKLKITNKVENTPQRKSLDIEVAAGDEPVRRLFLLFNEQQAGKWNVETLAKWGEGGKYVSTKGSLTKLDGKLDGELSLDSPHFQANKYSVRVSKSLTDGKHGVDITIDGNNKRQMAIAMTYAAHTESSTARSFEGTLKVEGQAVGKPIDFTGNFRLDDTKLERARDGEEGRSIKAALELTADNKPTKVKMLAKRSDKENHLQFSLCKDSDTNCRIGNIQLKHFHEDNGNLDYELRVTSEQLAGGASKETNGVVFQSKINRAQKYFEHVGKLIINEEKAEQVGYRIYCNPGGKEVGSEILLPTRVIALVLSGNRAGTGAYDGELAFFIDKTKNANRKISLLLTIGEVTKTTDNASGRSVEIVFKHPDLSKDLKVKTRYAFFGDHTYVELTTLLDVLQEGYEIEATYNIGKQIVTEGRVYTSVLSVVSKGLHINFGAKGEFKWVRGEVSYKNVITYENRQQQVKTSQVQVLISKPQTSFEIIGPNAKVLSLVSTYTHNPSNCELRFDTFLPGMEDTRVVRFISHNVSPRNIQMKISASSYPAEQYVEGFLGFKSDDEFTAGIYDHLADGRHTLADVNFALNGTRILSVKSDVGKDNARAVLTRLQQRNEKHTENLRRIASDAAEEIVQEVRHVSGNIRSAVPNFDPVVTAARTQLSELKQELDANEDTKLIVQKLTIASAYARHFTRAITELARTAKRIAYAYFSALVEALKGLPEKYSQVFDRLPEIIERLTTLINRGVDVLVSGSRVALKVLVETAERLYDSMPPFANVWNWIVDHTEEFVRCASKVIQKLSEKLAGVYSGLRSFVSHILSNRTLQAFIAEIKNRLQQLLEEFIEDTKEQLDAIKNYVLSTVPQREFQEFVEALADYIQKKANKAEIDDAAALRDIYEKLRATVRRAFADVFSVDLEKGIFRAKIPLPVSLKSLTEITKVFVWPSRPNIALRVPSYTYGIREFINQLKSGAAVNELVPPFKGYALLVGSKHYKTFDGRFFDFEGNCQYLLASDFDDGNFTVVVDYDRQDDVSRKSIIVTDGHDTVAIKPDNSIVVNGQTVELDDPKEAGSMLIERLGSWAVVRTKGAIVGCSATEDVCAVKVDGYYHGKVLGMLGTMNLEHFDDLRTPNGEIATSVQEFTESWKLDKQCTEPLIITTMIHATHAAEVKCKAALDSRRSSLRPCFGVVDPAPYRNVCEKLSQKVGYSEQKAVCTASVGYAKACYMSYAKVDYAPACAAAA